MNKVGIFRNYINPNLKFTGKIIKINNHNSTALFWIQYPIQIKTLLNKNRLKPNSFHFNDIIDKSFVPRVDDYIICNYIIDSCGNLFFINIESTPNITQKTLSSKSKYITRSRRSNKSSKKKNSYSLSTLKSLSKSKKKSIESSFSNITSSSIKCNTNLVKDNNTNNTRIFMILGHSEECALEDIDKEIANFLIYKKIKKLYVYHSEYMGDLTLKVLKLLEKEKHKTYILYTNLKNDIETMKNGEKVKCHIHKSIDASYFCNKCIDEPNIYFFCDKCINTHNKDHNSTLQKLNHRINLNMDFKNKIRYITGQSSGRAGIISTSFRIMENIQNMPNFRQLIYNSKDKKDMKVLDKELNNINKLYPGYHIDKLDTNFAIYPRKNKERIIPGPKNRYISFFPSDNELEPYTYTNGGTWPMGIFELPIFDIDNIEIYKDKYGGLYNTYSYKYEKMFNNNLYHIGKFVKSFYPEWEFYSHFKSVNPITIAKKALMLELMDKSIPKYKKKKSKIEIGQLKKWEKEMANITKFNKYIFDRMMKENNMHKKFPLDDIIRNTLRIGKIKPNEDVIFISNECRLIKYTNMNSTKWNQTLNSVAGPSVQILRNESRN